MLKSAPLDFDQCTPAKQRRFGAAASPMTNERSPAKQRRFIDFARFLLGS